MTIKITKAHKIKLNPTPEQAAYFWRCAGVSRKAWNWALGEYNKRKAAGEKVKIVGKGETLKSEFTALKATDYPWLGEVTSYAYQQAFADLQTAISRYSKFRKEGQLKPSKDWKGRKDGKPFGWPRFKIRGKARPSFYQANNSLKFDSHYAYIQKCPGKWVNMAETLRFDLRFGGKIMGGRISYQSGHWWLSVQVEVEHDMPESKPDSIGVDLGIKYLAVTSDGEIFDNPKAYEKAQRKLRRLQRKLDRQRRANNTDNYNSDGTPKKDAKDWKRSNNMLETERQISKLHYRVACIRNEASHQMTTKLARNYGVIGVEDLNIEGMKQNRRISKAISDAALYEKRRQLTYKADWNGGVVVPVSRWFPSSKMCNVCDWINVDLKRKDREWTCQGCGTIHHRDGNASINIENEALKILNMSPDYLDGDTKRPTETLAEAGH